MRRVLVVLVSIVAAQGLPLAGRQEPQRPVFRTAVDLLRVDVQVVANDGQPIADLGLDDFAVAIDGRPRRIVSAELVRYSQAATNTPASVPIRTPGRVPEDGRLYVLAVDQVAFSTAAVMPLREAVARFIKQLRPEDMIGLYDFPFREPILDLTHNHAAVANAFMRVIGLHQPGLGVFGLAPSEIIDITASDIETFARVVRRECASSDLSCPGAIRQEASAIAGYLETEAQQRLSALSNMVRGLARVAGRKTIVLVSGGMISSTRVGGRPDVATLMNRVGEEAAAADANLYVLHWDSSFLDAYSAAGNRPSRSPSDRFESLFADRQALSQGLEWLAGKAGGAMLRVEAGTGDVAFSRVLRETAAYYLLGVEPTEDDRDGKAHFLRVNVNQRGATVRSRTKVLIPRRTSSS